jgi:hypothetical protein
MFHFMKIRGWNEFYDGWLAWVLMQPHDIAKSDAWKDGWEMGQETSDHAVMVLRDEIKAGHVLVEKDAA